MADIFVLSGEKRIGPLAWEVARQGMIEGIYSAEQMAWTEGMEEWLPLAEVLGVETEIETGEVIAEGGGFVLFEHALQVREERFPLGFLLGTEVETEHTKRGRAIFWSILFGVLTIVTLAMPLRPETRDHWVLWAVSLAVFLLVFVRSLLAAFKSTPAFVSIHLQNGDDRILPMSHREAKEASRRINAAIESARDAAEADQTAEGADEGIGDVSTGIS